jgi:hypothetical protein
VLNSIDVSQYRTGTTRTQPELVSTHYDQADLTVLKEWLKAAGDPEAIPDNKKISRIQVLGFFCDVEGQIVRSDGYMYVTFEDGTGYSKLANLQE